MAVNFDYGDDSPRTINVHGHKLKDLGIVTSLDGSYGCLTFHRERSAIHVFLECDELKKLRDELNRLFGRPENPPVAEAEATARETDGLPNVGGDWSQQCEDCVDSCCCDSKEYHKTRRCIMCKGPDRIEEAMRGGLDDNT